jgi:hypothetical protein
MRPLVTGLKTKTFVDLHFFSIFRKLFSEKLFYAIFLNGGRDKTTYIVINSRQSKSLSGLSVRVKIGERVRLGGKIKQGLEKETGMYMTGMARVVGF